MRRINTCNYLLLLLFISLVTLCAAENDFQTPHTLKMGTTGTFVVICTTTQGEPYIASIAPREYWIEKVDVNDPYSFSVAIVAPAIANIMINKCKSMLSPSASLASVALKPMTSVNSGLSYPVIALSVLSDEAYRLTSNSDIQRFLTFFHSKEINSLDKELLTADHENMRAFEAKISVAPETDPMRIYFFQRSKEFTDYFMYGTEMTPANSDEEKVATFVAMKYAALEIYKIFP